MSMCPSEEDLACYAAGDCSADQTAAITAHLGDCDRCGAWVDRAKTDAVWLRGIQPARSPNGMSSEWTGGEGPTGDPTRPRADADWDGSVDEKESLDIPADAIEGYEILRELHRGGQGVVYQAIQKSTHRKVALKVMLEGPFASKHTKLRFEREIELIASLHHPNIVAVFDSGISHDRYWYAMDYIRGRPLHRYVTGGKMSVADTLGVFLKVCGAVIYAHQRGVIHRDLKPGNILVDGLGEPYVLDFGLAKVAGAEVIGDSRPMLVSVTGQVVGTLPYMSPEQARGDPGQIDIRTDVYSLGVILYEMLTDKYPYKVVGRMAEVLKNIAECEPRKPSTIRRQIDNDVETIILKALSKDVDRRYQSARELARDIGHYLSGEPIEAKHDSGWYVLRKTLRHYRPQIAIAGSLSVLTVWALVMTALFFWHEAEDANRAKTEADDQKQHMSIERDQAEEQAKALADLKDVDRYEQQPKALADLTLEEPLTEDRSRRVEDLAPQEQVVSERPDIEGLFRDSLECAHEAMDLGASVVALRSFDRAESLAERLTSTQDETLEGRKELVRRNQVLGDLAARIGLREKASRFYYENLRLADEWCVEEPRDPGHRRLLVATHVRLGDLVASESHVAAFEYYTQALEALRPLISPPDPDESDLRRYATVLQRLGEIEVARGNYAEALRMHEESLSAVNDLLAPEPDDETYRVYAANGREKIGDVLLKQGDGIGALKSYKESLDMRERLAGEYPDEIAYKRDLAISLNKVARLTTAPEQIHEAAKLFRRVVALVSEVWSKKPGDTTAFEVRSYAYERLAHIHKALGHRQDARTYAIKAIANRKALVAAQPDVPHAPNALAWLLLTVPIEELREPSRALELAQAAMERSPTSAQYANTLALAYLRNGQSEEAIRTANHAIEWASPPDPSNYLILSIASEHLGRAEDARRFYRKATEKLSRLGDAVDPETRELQAEAAKLAGVGSTS